MRPGYSRAHFLFRQPLPGLVHQVQLRHQLIADHREHLLQLVHVLFREALAHPLDHGAQIGIADVVVVDIQTGGALGFGLGGII